MFNTAWHMHQWLIAAGTGTYNAFSYNKRATDIIAVRTLTKGFDIPLAAILLLLALRSHDESRCAPFVR